MAIPALVSGLAHPGWDRGVDVVEKTPADASAAATPRSTSSRTPGTARPRTARSDRVDIQLAAMTLETLGVKANS